MPRFTVWLSDEDYSSLKEDINSDNLTDKELDIAIDLVNQVLGVPEDPTED